MPNPKPTAKAPSVAVSAILAWVLPGLGHWWIGERVRGAIFFVVLTVTFWGGVAVGGVRTTVATPSENGAWFYAQLCMGPQTMGGLYLGQAQVEKAKAVGKEAPKAAWPAANIAVVYSGVAGLLNLLVIIDVVARADARRSGRRASPTAPTAARKAR